MSTSDIFEEWDAYATRRQLVEREINLDAVADASQRKIVGITGIRRSGKSSLLMLLRQRLAQRGERAAYINLEDTRLRSTRQPLDDAIKWFGDEGTLLLDEVTASPDHEGWLARTHELLKDRLRLVVTSSRGTLAAPSKSLRGRILPVEIYPLSLREYLTFKEIVVDSTTAGRGILEKAFQEYLRLGGFPEVCLTPDETEKVTILGTYMRDIMGLDVAEASGIDLATVKAFTEYALQAPTFSASKTLKHLKALGYRIGKDRILTLEHYTASSYIIHYTHIYSYNIKDRAQYPRKAYPGDTGFVYALQGRTDTGRLTEIAVLHELKRRTTGVTEINYWKGQAGAETDFVIRRGNTVEEAIQVSWDISNPKTYSRETRGLAMCAKELKAGKATILTNGPRDEVKVNGVTITVKPIIDWLNEPQP
ncbi:ATP-binding protein [Candidatus Bathyarchaeota archaeon]|nr:ATP-binding protein [Candidatus Bathyarchaeota archaeon]